MEWVDNSILESAAKCSTQALMRYVFGYCDKSGMKMANVGKAIHAAHEAYFVDWNAQGAVEVFSSTYDSLLGPYLSELEPNDPCQKENVKAVLEQYYKAHPAEFFPFKPLVEGIEKVHNAPLTDGVQFFGLIDLPTREKETGALYPCDHKNRFGYINEWWTKKFGLTSQFTGYIWLTQQIFNEVVPGMYINAIEVKKLPDPVSTKCRTHGVAYEQCRLQHAKWQLFISLRSPTALQNWYTQAVALAQKFLMLKANYTSVEMVQYAPDEGRFSGACVFCDFRKWCRADRAPALVDGMFSHSPWQPWLTEGEH